MRDEIIEELWRIKDAMSAEHGRDVRAMAAYLRGVEQRERARTRNTNASNPADQSPRHAKPDSGEPS